MKGQKAELVKNIVNDIITPAIKKHVSRKHTKIPDKSWTVMPIFNGIEWSIHLQKQIEINAMGEQDVPYTEEIVAATMPYQILFWPHGCRIAPEMARITISWEKSIITYDDEMLTSIFRKYLCVECEGVKGYNCKCTGEKTEAIHLGEIKRNVDDMADDAMAAMTHFNIPKKTATNIVRQVKQEQAHKITDFNEFIKQCLKIYNEMKAA